MSTLNINDVASVEFLMDASLAAVYGTRAGGAVILITTKMGDDDIETNPVQPFAYYSPPGYYKARVFYSPQYNANKSVNQNKDLRTTIYWNPDVVTGADGKAKFDYFNADEKGTYRVVIEGIDENGNIGRQVYRYKLD
jgi:TonB-dependent SusC/RagA subfamily outer membrane receptor